MNHNGHAWHGAEIMQHEGVRQERPRVLLAEDDDEMRSLLASALRRDGYEVRTCTNGINLLERVAPSFPHGGAEDYALIISDIRMPGLSGLEVLADLQGHRSAPPLILITAFGDEATHAQAKRLGAVAVFDKPFPIDRLLDATHRIVGPQEVGRRHKRYLELEVTAGAILREAERWHRSHRRRSAAQRFSGRWIPSPGWVVCIKQPEEHPDPTHRTAVLWEEGSDTRIIVVDSVPPQSGETRFAVEGRIRVVGRDSITLDLAEFRPLGAWSPATL